jgi:hypothetical protein
LYWNVQVHVVVVSGTWTMLCEGEIDLEIKTQQELGSVGLLEEVLACAC